jgi:hypothetical protein
MPKAIWPLILLILPAFGCANSHPDDYAKGQVDPSLYSEAELENKQRLAGEDRFVVPIYDSPRDAVARGLSLLFAPVKHFGDWLDKDTPITAAKLMLDFQSADNRRIGTFRLNDFPYTRIGPTAKLYITVYVKEAADPDFTVRAAAVRALNRSRATGFTDLFVNLLDKDEHELVRLEAVDALGNIPDSAAIPALINHIDPRSEASATIRMACTDALRNFKTKQVAAALINALQDTDFGVVWQARQSLALITAQDYRYDRVAWLGYLSAAKME